MKALIIDEPWISMILEGRKTWELRKSNTRILERIGLIRKGSGTVVGEATLIAVHGPLTVTELVSHKRRHGASKAGLSSYAAGKCLFAWEFADVTRIKPPRPYAHPQGAVIWVTLS